MCKLLEEMCDEVRLEVWIEAAKNIMAHFNVSKETAVETLGIPSEYSGTVLAAF